MSAHGLNQRQAPFIQTGAEFCGLVRFQGSLWLDGCVRGSVCGTGSLHLSATATIIGDVQARSLDLHGAIEGDVLLSEGARLGASAVLFGSLRAASLVLEEGAKLCAHPLQIWASEA